MVKPLYIKEYEECISQTEGMDYKATIDYFISEILYFWVDRYIESNNRETNIVSVKIEGFEYIFDDQSSLVSEDQTDSTDFDSRVVVAFGYSNPSRKTRDDSRLRGWVGATEKYFGTKWDKGHFIANSIGGMVDGAEINVFQQRRDLNRGWSDEGKSFTSMEKYCSQNPGTFCFHHPSYSDRTARPEFLEFGIIKPDKSMWVESFDNRDEIEN